MWRNRSVAGRCACSFASCLHLSASPRAVLMASRHTAQVMQNATSSFEKASLDWFYRQGAGSIVKVEQKKSKSGFDWEEPECKIKHRIECAHRLKFCSVGRAAPARHRCDPRLRDHWSDCVRRALLPSRQRKGRAGARRRRREEKGTSLTVRLCSLPRLLERLVLRHMHQPQRPTS